MIQPCATCGVAAFETETGVCVYCVDVAASEKAKAEAAGKTDPPDLLKGSVGAVADAIAAVTDVDQLAALAAAETAGKNRKGVLDAIAARTAALQG